MHIMCHVTMCFLFVSSTSSTTITSTNRPEILHMFWKAPVSTVQTSGQSDDVERWASDGSRPRIRTGRWLNEVKQPRWWLMLTTQLHATFAVRWWRTYSDVTFMTLQEWDTERRRGEIMSSITLPFWDKINQTLFSYLLNKCQVSLLASRRRKRKGGWCKLCVPLAY